MDYLYELKADGAVLATGHVSVDGELRPGDELPYGGSRTMVEKVIPQVGGTPKLLLRKLD